MKRRHTIPIRDVLETWTEAKKDVNRYDVQDPYIPAHQSKAEKKFNPPQRDEVEFDLDPDQSGWSPFEVNDLSSKQKILLKLEDYMEDVLKYYSTRDRTLEYVSESLQLVKTYTDPRGIRPPKYTLEATPPGVKQLEEAFKKPTGRIVIWVHVGTPPKLEISLLCVVYRKLEASALVVELYHPDLAQMDDHPAFDTLDSQILELLDQVQNTQTDALIGLLDSDMTNDEWVSYLPFLSRYNTVPEYMFGYLWNAFLFLDRVCEPVYKLKDVKQIMYNFKEIDVDTRKKAYLAFLMFIIRFRWYLYVESN